jgi:hypothetical protein
MHSHTSAVDALTPALTRKYFNPYAMATMNRSELLSGTMLSNNFFFNIHQLIRISTLYIIFLVD